MIEKDEPMLVWNGFARALEPYVDGEVTDEGARAIAGPPPDLPLLRRASGRSPTRSGKSSREFGREPHRRLWVASFGPTFAHAADTADTERCMSSRLHATTVAASDGRGPP